MCKSLCAFLLLLFPSLAMGAIAQLQHVLTPTSGTNPTVIAISSTAANSLLVLAVVDANTGGTISGVSDNKSNTWHDSGVSQTMSACGCAVYLWYAANVALNTTSINVNIGASNSAAFNTYEFSGVSTSSPLDQKGNAINTSATPAGPSLTPSVANELFIGSAMRTNFNITGISSPFHLDSNGVGFPYGFFHISTDTLTEQATFTCSSSDTVGSVMVTFKPASATNSALKTTMELVF